MNRWEKLANAIVMQAVRDYRTLARQQQLTGDYEQSQREINEPEEFFRSDWFRELSSVDGTRLLNNLRKEVCA